ncbi:hypothetical protein [Amycolatopsis sp. NPDC004625]
MAPTAEVVAGIDAIQYRTGQWLCLNAIADHQVYCTGEPRR